MLTLDDSAWRTVRIERQTIAASASGPCRPDSLAEAADAAHNALGEMGYAGQPALLALGSSWCVASAVAVPSPRHARNRQAMVYLLEPQLPWAVEDLVVDYEVHGTTALMVAVKTEPLRGFIDRLEQLGGRIESVTPLARLALATYLADQPAPNPQCVLASANTEAVDLWLLDQGRPVAWHRCANNSKDVAQAVGQMTLGCHSPPPLVGRGLTAELQQRLGPADPQQPPPDANPNAATPLEAAAIQAAQVLSGRRDPAIELRRGGLAAGTRRRAIRPHLRAAQAAFCLVLAATALAFFLKTRQLSSLRNERQDQQAAVFHDLFPQRRVPVGVHGALESQLAHLRGVRGDATDLPDSHAAVEVMIRLLKAAPTNLRWRLLEFRIDDGRLYLVGQVRSHADADQIANALRNTGLDVDSPSTRSLQPKGVEFRISARLSKHQP